VRLGITVSDVRMLPVEYSEVSISAPNTTMTSVLHLRHQVAGDEDRAALGRQ